MRAGTANEAVVLNALRAEPFVLAVFEVGSVALKDHPEICASADGMARVLRPPPLPEGDVCDDGLQMPDDADEMGSSSCSSDVDEDAAGSGDDDDDVDGGDGGGRRRGDSDDGAGWSDHRGGGSSDGGRSDTEGEGIDRDCPIRVSERRGTSNDDDDDRSDVVVGSDDGDDRGDDDDDRGDDCCNAVNVWRLLQAGQRRWRGLATFRRRCSQQPFPNVLEDLVVGLLLKQPTAVEAGAQVEDTCEDFSDYQVPTRNIDRFFLSGPGRRMRLNRQGLHTAAPLRKNASTGNTMQRCCVVCDHKTTLMCTLCQIPLCVNRRSCWTDFHHPAYAGRQLDQNQQKQKNQRRLQQWRQQHQPEQQQQQQQLDEAQADGQAQAYEQEQEQKQEQQ
jgi:hypothetical protein